MDTDEIVGCFIYSVALIVLGFFLGVVTTHEKITAMDVYQGKTTLEYTIVDGVKVDSCVIWKSN